MNDSNQAIIDEKDIQLRAKDMPEGFTAALEKRQESERIQKGKRPGKSRVIVDIVSKALGVNV